ncbi:MAG: TolC family protein [Alphaproteobacteria bacterium]|nr:TolC family protein [Alphaproteobacteria bacterium]
MKKQIAYLFIICLLLTSCVSSKQEKPTLSEELNYTSNTASAYVVDKKWWLAYNNQELNALVEQALKNNPDYLKAALQIEKELYALNLTTTDLFPTLSGNLSTSAQRRIDKHENTKKTFSGEAGLNYELDLYGKIRDAREAQNFEYEATIMDKEAAELALVNNVVDLYFNLSYLKNSIQMSQENVKNYNKIYNIVQAKHLAGKIDELDVTKARQSLASEKIKLLDLETQFTDLERSLKNIVNLKPSESLNLAYISFSQQQTFAVDLDVPLSVLAERPDLKASQLRLEKSFKNLQAQDKNWYPNVSLRGVLGSSSDKARTTFDFPYLLGSVGVDLPFLDWNSVKNNIKISEADYQIELIDFKDTLNQALNETAYYYYAYQTTSDALSLIEAKHQDTQKQTKYYQQRYDVGKIELKDLLDALNSENTARVELIKQKYMVVKYENYVYKALAGKYSGR